MHWRMNASEVYEYSQRELAGYRLPVSTAAEPIHNVSHLADSTSDTTRWTDFVRTL